MSVFKGLTPVSNGQSIFIIGAGGMAREVRDLLATRGMGHLISAFIEENPARPDLRIGGTRVLSTADRPPPGPEITLVMGIGSVRRKRLAEALLGQSHTFMTVIDPRAVVSPTAAIGRGAVILAGAVISSDTVIEEFGIVNYGASISHDCRIGSYSTICPGVKIGGYCRVGAQTWVGIGATIKDRITVGEKTYIGAGACVVQDLPSRVLAYGVPARVVRAFDPDTEELTR